MNKFIPRIHIHHLLLLRIPKASVRRHQLTLDGKYCLTFLGRHFGTTVQDIPGPVFLKAENFPEKVALIDQNGMFKYQDLLHYGKLLSDDLVQIVKSNPTDVIEETEEIDVDLKAKTIGSKRVAFLCENDVSYVVAQWATWMAGGVAVPLCTTHPSSELEYVIQNCQCSVIVASDKFREKITAISTEHKIPLKVVSQSDYTCDYTQNAWFSDQESLRFRKSLVQSNWYRNQPCMMIYTSGTTGRPKASNSESCTYML